MVKFAKQLAVVVLLLGFLAPSGFSQNSQPPKEDISMTLEATPVDPAIIAEEAQPQAKKPLPLYLQPFEFIFSSIAHAIMFWKTD